MANKDHLAILKQGVEVWNEWRRKNPSINPDFSREHLEKDQLIYETFFQWADLRGVNLAGGLLSRLSLFGSILSEADLKGADLSGADLSTADLITANLHSADLRGAKGLTEAQVKAAKNWEKAYYSKDILKKLGLNDDHNETLIKKQSAGRYKPLLKIVGTLIGAYVGVFSIMLARHEFLAYRATIARANFMTMVSSGPPDALISAMASFGPLQNHKVSHKPKFLKPWKWFGKLRTPNKEPLLNWARSGSDLRAIDLSRADLSGADLSKVDLSKTDLRKADLSGANLADADLRGADLRKADLTGAKGLTETQLKSAKNWMLALHSEDFLKKLGFPSDHNNRLKQNNLSGYNLSKEYLSGADLTGVDLSNADLSGANLNKADLSGADLSKAELGGAKGLTETQIKSAKNWALARYSGDLLKELGIPSDINDRLKQNNPSGAILGTGNLGNGHLKGADLSGVNLSKGDLSGADLSKAKLEGAGLSGANLNKTDLGGTDLSGADLGNGNLSGANLSKTDLSGADLRGANLSKADLRGADLNGANLSKGDLGGANLSGANLSGANLNKADMSGANLSKGDLSGADLSKAKLEGADLSGANLNKADLGSTDLSGANLSGANLSGANLSKTDLSGANLNGANLSKGDLGGANLSGANLNKADLSGANLSGANLSQGNLNGSSMNKGDLKRTNLSGSNLSKANLTGANLSGANLNNANLKEANLSSANLYNAEMKGTNLSKVDLSCADLSKGDLGRADLSKGNLRGANLSGANLSGTNLNKANLRGADLNKGDLSGANLTGVDLSKANLRGVKGLTVAQIKSAKNWMKAHYNEDILKMLNFSTDHNEILPTQVSYSTEQNPIFLRSYGFVPSQCDALVPSLNRSHDLFWNSKRLKNLAVCRFQGASFAYLQCLPIVGWEDYRDHLERAELLTEVSSLVQEPILDGHNLPLEPVPTPWVVFDPLAMRSTWIVFRESSYPFLDLIDILRPPLLNSHLQCFEILEQPLSMTLSDRSILLLPPLTETQDLPFVSLFPSLDVAPRLSLGRVVGGRSPDHLLPVVFLKLRQPPDSPTHTASQNVAQPLCLDLG